MRIKIILFSIAVAVSASAFCFASCVEEVATLNDTTYITKNNSDDDKSSTDEDSAGDESTAEDSGTESSAAGDAGTEESAGSESPTDDSGTESSAAGDAGTEEPAGSEGAMADSGTESSAGGESSTADSGTEGTATGESSTVDSGTEGSVSGGEVTEDEDPQASAGTDVTEENEESDGEADLQEGETGEEQTGEEQTDNAYGLEHHEYVAATCKSDGNLEYWYSAESGSYYLDAAATEEVTEEDIVIPAESIEHSGEWVIDLSPTCVSYGACHFTCIVCGDILMEKIKPTGEHVFGEWKTITEASCEHAGIMERKCKNCDEVERKEIEPLEHEYVEINREEATCGECGYIEYECAYCKGTYTEEIERLGHDMNTVEAKEATCTEDGWQEYEKCSRCDYTTYTDETVIPATGHKYYDTVIEPTIDSEGYTLHVCTICEYYEKDNYTPKLSFTLEYELTSDGGGYIVIGIEEGVECTDLVIPGYYNDLPVTEIAESAFFGNTAITSVKIGENVTTIGASAFNGCTSISTLYIPQSLQNFGQYAFAGCTHITEITYNAISASVDGGSLGTFNNAGRESDGITLYVGSSVTKIPANLFASVGYSTSSANIVEIIFVGDSVLETIGGYAFAGCDGLESVYIPSSCIKIANGAFMNCTSLVYAEVPSSATFNEDYVFYNVGSGFECKTYSV